VRAAPMLYEGHATTVGTARRGVDEALIMHEPGGRPSAPDTFCLPHTVLPKPSAAENGPTAVAGTILRVYKSRDVGELRSPR